ncbi:hypothetical protein FKW77_008526 [Venturia effusa]|uniref:Zn(2)-C6 fungal-type domain-containing protein n=1 Tax=Venturia effusa TaxID=50376 RepID=A0A517LEB5_9PEZI|nr:hypothetical protein FKW77_008526 [Venturia effusa]
MRSRCVHERKRTGCVTCKTRHVRCGEEKPICHNCKRLKKECSYAPTDDAARPRRRTKTDITFKAVTFPLAPTTHPQAPIKKATSSRERRVFDFFCQRTVPLLSHNFSSEFWTYDVLQMFESVPAIRHCILALASLHLDAHDGKHEIGATEASSCCLTSSSTSHYFGALSCLRRAIDPAFIERSSLEVALVASTLLAIYESLLGCGKQSRIHVHHGIQLALQSQSDGANSRVFFPTVRLLGTFKLGQRMLSREGDTAAEKSFDSMFMDLIALRQADSEIEKLVFKSLSVNHKVVQFATDCDSGKFVGRTEERHAMHSHLLNLVQDCRGDLANADYPDAHAVKILRSQLELTWIILRRGMDGGQTSYDGCTQNFETILHLVESVLVGRDQVNQPPLAFSIDLGFIPLLLFVARLCRQPILRRKAIDMLAMCPPTDGNWDRQRAIAAARAVIRFEEQCEDDDAPHPIPEERRVHHILFDDSNSETSKSEENMRITLMTRPKGDTMGFNSATFHIPVERLAIG